MVVRQKRNGGREERERTWDGMGFSPSQLGRPGCEAEGTIREDGEDEDGRQREYVGKRSGRRDSSLAKNDLEPVLEGLGQESIGFVNDLQFQMKAHL
jgi:hypothetical protein